MAAVVSFLIRLLFRQVLGILLTILFAWVVTFTMVDPRMAGWMAIIVGIFAVIVHGDRCWQLELRGIDGLGIGGEQ